MLWVKLISDDLIKEVADGIYTRKGLRKALIEFPKERS